MKHTSKKGFKQAANKILNHLSNPSLSESIPTHYKIPKKSNPNLPEIAQKTAESYSTLFGSSQSSLNLIGLANRPYVVKEAFYGDFFEETHNSPHFNWICNPTMADTEIIFCERLRRFMKIPEEFSYGAQGISKIALSLNDVLILSMQYSKVRKINEENEKIEKFTVYGFEDLKHTKPARILGIDNFRETVFFDDFGLEIDFDWLTEKLSDDVKKGYSPLYYLYSPRSLERVGEELTQLLNLKNKFRFDILLDLSHLDLNCLNLKLNENLLKRVDFIHCDLSKIGGLMSSIMFMKDRVGFTNSLSIVERDYYQVNLDDIAESGKKLMTEEKYDAHNFAIGFAHKTSLMRLFYAFEILGKEGIQEIVEDSNIKTKEIEAEFLRRNLTGAEIRVRSNRVYFKIDDDIESLYQETAKMAGYELFSLRKFKTNHGNISGSLGEFVSYSGEIQSELIQGTMDKIFN